MSRIVKKTTIRGIFAIPLGLRFLGREVGDYPKSVLISTVCLDNGHLEDPLQIVDAESGYETMVFPDECSFFSLYTEKHASRREAARGHTKIVRQLLKGTLPLSIAISYYRAWDVVSKPQDASVGLMG